MFKIIAETAFSHEGNFDYLLKQIHLAKKAKVNFVKFQIFLDKNDYIVKSHPMYKLLDQWMFTKEQWEKAFKVAKSLGLKILALPLNITSLNFCIENDNIIDIYEVHSVCFNDIKMLEQLKTTSKKIILGIGGRIPREIEFAKNILNKKDLILMYGFQSFPTDKSKLVLNKIIKFQKKFKCDMGFADHTSFDDNSFLELNSYAYILGVKYFEKHIVVEKGKKRVDYESGIAVKEFIKMREYLIELKNILGDGNIYKLNDKEQTYKNREKQIVANLDIKKGNIISEKYLAFKISEDASDFKQSDFYNITGKKAQKNIKKNSPLKFNHIK